MMIQGVLGPIDTAELGQTLMHEHITCADWSMRMNFGCTSGTRRRSTTC